VGGARFVERRLWETGMLGWDDCELSESWSRDGKCGVTVEENRELICPKGFVVKDLF